MSKFVILNKGVIDKVSNCRRQEGSEGAWDGRVDRLIGLEIQPLQMPVVFYSITTAKCAVCFYDCQLDQVSITTTTYTIYIFSEYIYYTYAIFVIGKHLLFQSASRLINGNKIHCKCCFRQGLVICILNCTF